MSSDIKDEARTDNNLLQATQFSSPSKQSSWQGKTRGHHKQGSDCTLIDGLQQEIEIAARNEQSIVSLEEEPRKTLDVKEMKAPATNDKLKSDTNPITNFVSFIRTNSMRFKRNLNRDDKDSSKKKDTYPPPPNLEGLSSSPKSASEKVNEPALNMPAKKMVHSKSYSEFEEICRSAHGLLRKSVPGPVTFHKSDYPNKFTMSRKSGLNKTFPCRSRSKFESADSGFESCASSIVFPQIKRKKCAVPLTLHHEVSKSAGCDNFQFRENHSPNSFLRCEAMLPALTDVSDDESDDKPELFFGRFPCKPKIPLRTARDIYKAQQQSIDVSDSDSDEPFTNKRIIFPQPSRSSSSGSSISREDIKRILTEWSLPDESASDESPELVISPCPGDHESLQKLFSEGVESVEMVCEGGSENKILTGRIVLWTPEYKQKVKKVFISRQRAGSITPDNSIKLMKDNGKWTICTPSMTENVKTTIFLTVETDTERSESISTTATSPIYEDDYKEDNFDTDEELYFNMREHMKSLDQDIDNTPNQDDLPCSVIDYMNRDMA